MASAMRDSKHFIIYITLVEFDSNAVILLFDFKSRKKISICKNLHSLSFCLLDDIILKYVF